jgi:DNA polymerase I
MTPLIFDIETNGLNPTKVHCLVIKKDNEVLKFVGNDIPKGIDLMANNLVVGHNCIKYDLPVLEKLYNYTHNKDYVHDTLCLSRLIYPDIGNSLDMKLLAKGTIDSSIVGKHSLKSWGVRLQLLKGSFGESTDWQAFTNEMLDYCVRDVEITSKLYTVLIKKGFSKESIELEHDIVEITKELEKTGFGFDEIKAKQFHAVLSNKVNVLKLDLENTFKEWEEDLGDFIPKVNNKKLGYVKGVPVKKTKQVKFNPSSRHHIANRLSFLYGWKPKEYTDKGQPIVDEEVLVNLEYPEAKLISEYLTIEKRLGMLADGNRAWLKAVTKGRIHTTYITNLTTGRMSSRSPNLQQVPSSHTPYGLECRELFIPSHGYKLVGVDAKSLEAVCLSHYVYNYPKGKEFADMLMNGDVHTDTQKRLGLKDRATAKRILYAVLYGASYKRVAEICEVTLSEGKEILDRFYLALPFLKMIRQDIIEKLEATGIIRGLDKRILTVRSNHSSLNLLIQSCGAIIMKKALVLLHRELKNYDARILATIHDEFQIEAKPEITDRVGQLAVQCIEKAGKHFQLRVPVTGEYRVGNNWAETH